MPARHRPPLEILNEHQLLQRPIEPNVAKAADPDGTIEVDDALHVTIKEDEEGVYADINTYIADAALVSSCPKIVNEAIEAGFTRYDQRPIQFMFPRFVLDSLSLGQPKNKAAPAIAIRSKIYEESGRRVLTGIERVLVSVETMNYSELSRQVKSGNPEADAISWAAHIIARSSGFGKQHGLSFDAHKIIGFHMMHANTLVANSAVDLHIPWIFRNFPATFEDERGVTQRSQWAQYGEQPLGHHALRGVKYCHFTSPLRRSPDLANHVNICAVLEGRRPPFDDIKMRRIARRNNAAVNHVGPMLTRVAI